MGYALYFLIINIATYAAYWQDKRAARERGWRVPEGTLLLLGFMGGTIAGFLAQRRLRHKTSKLSFQVKFWIVTVLQLLILTLAPEEIRRLAARF